jgi:hypothetical protein
MSDDTPTERFEAPTPAASPGGDRRSKTLIVVLSILGGILLIAVVVLLTLLFSRGIGAPSANPAADVSPSASTGETPSASPSETPSETPSASPSESPSSAPPPPPPPPPAGPTFTKLNHPSSQSCSAGGPSFPPTRPAFTVSWSSTGAAQAWFVNGTDDAANSGYMQIPLSGNQNDFPYEQTVDCSDGSNTYTITLVGSNGKHVSKSWTVQITGDHF